MPVRTWLLACGFVVVAGCKDGCGSKTPVPFKRDPLPAQTLEPMARDAPVPQQYADATRSITLAEREVSRAEGSFRASLERELGGDGALHAFVIATDASGRASFETWTRAKDAEAAPENRASVALTTPGTGCILSQAKLASIAADLALATLELACAADLEPAKAPTPEVPAPSEPPAPSTTTDPAAAEPDARAVARHQFVVSVDAAPKVLLHIAALPPSAASPATPLSLLVASRDQDGDGHSDVLVTAELGHAGLPEPSRVPLVWLNRPSGLARERTEPEHSLTAAADAAYSTAATDPLAALPAATQVLDTHRVLCQESGAARLWVDESLGLACGASAAAGRAAVVRALALAKQQQLLPALQARSQLDAAGYRVEAADRARVNAAIAAIRGQTSYVWERGPDLAAPSAPSLRVPALGFATEEQLLLRGSLGQSYDLRTRVSTPSSIAPGVVMTAPGGKFAIVDMVRDCAGQYLRTVPASSIVSGFVVGGRAEDWPLAQERPAAKGCTGGTRRPDRSGWSVLGVTQDGALLAQGASLQLVPFDASGKSAGPGRLLGPSESAPPLLAAGALSQTGLRHALPTSEGVAVIDRGTKPTTTLIRSPASCAGAVSDVAISPSGQRIAMVCSGRVYWAHEAQAQAPHAASNPPALGVPPSP